MHRTPIFINSNPRPHVRDQTLGSFRATQILSKIFPFLTPKRQRKARRLFLQATFGNAPATDFPAPPQISLAYTQPTTSNTIAIANTNSCYTGNLTAAGRGSTSNLSERQNQSYHQNPNRNHSHWNTTTQKKRNVSTKSQRLTLNQTENPSSSQLPQDHARPKLSRTKSVVFEDIASSGSSGYGSDSDGDDDSGGNNNAYKIYPSSHLSPSMNSTFSSFSLASPSSSPSSSSSSAILPLAPRQTSTLYNNTPRQLHFASVDNNRRYLNGVQYTAQRLLEIDILSSTAQGPDLMANIAWIQEWQSIRGMSQEQAEHEFSEYMRVMLLQFQQQQQQQQKRRVREKQRGPVAM